MNIALLKNTAKSNWLILVIFLAIMFMYLSIIISMFDPESLEGLTAFMETLPRELIAIMGMDVIPTTLTAFLAGYFYSFLAIMFPMIYCIIIANRLIARHVDRGSMAYLLATPNSRFKIVTTQALYLLLSLCLLFGFLTLGGIMISEIMFPGHLDIGVFVFLNFLTLLTFFALGGISFFFSCLFHETKHSLALGAGVPVAFFVIDMLANVDEQYSWVGNFSLLTLLNPAEIVAGHPSPAMIIGIMAVIAFITNAAGIFVFTRKDLLL